MKTDELESSPALALLGIIARLIAFPLLLVWAIIWQVVEDWPELKEWILTGK